MKTHSGFAYDSSLRESTIRQFVYSLIASRDLVTILVRRDLFVRYRRSFLGLIWSMLNPILSSLVMWVVFVNIFRARLVDGAQFAPYVLAGVLLISFFTQGFIQAADSIAGGVGILQKIYVRPEIFAVSSAISSSTNFAFGLVALFAVNLITGNGLSNTFPLILIVVICMVALITGLGLMAAILFINFDDSRNIVTIILQLLMYLTPVFYPKSILSERVELLVSLNPLTSFLDIFRSTFANSGTATTFDWSYMLISATSSLFIGIFVFERFWKKTVGMM